MDRIVRDFSLHTLLGWADKSCGAAPPRSNEARNDSQVNNRKLNRGSVARGTEKEDGARQHDPWTKLQQAGLDAPSHGGAQTALQSLVCTQRRSNPSSVSFVSVFAVRCCADVVWVLFALHVMLL